MQAWPDPEYIETPNTVRLILRNNIDERTAHRNRASSDDASEAVKGFEDIWTGIDDTERQIILILKNKAHLAEQRLPKVLK